MNGVYRFDIAGFRAINVGLHSSWLDPVSTVLSYSGLGVSATIICLLFSIWRETRPFVLPLLATLFVSGVLVSDGLKQVIARDRPSNLAFAFREEPHLLGSFPSGHTTISFGMATMLVLLTKGTSRAWLGWVSLIWAALVGLSRIYRGVHWPTDVLAGVCAGTGSACLVFLVQKTYRSSPKNSST